MTPQATEKDQPVYILHSPVCPQRPFGAFVSVRDARWGSRVLLGVWSLPLCGHVCSVCCKIDKALSFIKWNTKWNPTGLWRCRLCFSEEMLCPTDKEGRFRSTTVCVFKKCEAKAHQTQSWSQRWQKWWHIYFVPEWTWGKQTILKTNTFSLIQISWVYKKNKHQRQN